MSVCYKEALKSLKRILNDRWNNSWEGSCTIYNIHCIKNDTYQTSHALLFDRKYQVTLSRLRIGYANFTYLLKEERQPILSRCGVTNSVEHTIASCPKYQWERRFYHVKENLKKRLALWSLNVFEIYQYSPIHIL